MKRTPPAGQVEADGAGAARAVGVLISVSGTVLMTLEIAGSRVLAWVFGSSVFVWGSLIGIAFGATSGGDWLGGWPSALWPRQVRPNALLAAGAPPCSCPCGRRRCTRRSPIWGRAWDRAWCRAWGRSGRPWSSSPC
jgi:hypothetical protein